MSVISGDSPLFLYPDPVTGPDKLSGAAFLYFDGPLIFTAPPQVTTHESYQLLQLVDERRPDWGPSFKGILQTWLVQQEHAMNMLNTLGPLRSRIKVVWLIYPADKAALESAVELKASTDLTWDALASMADLDNGCGELIRHIMLEAFLSLSQDVHALFEYCTGLFAGETISHLLAKSYILRLSMLPELAKGHQRLLLTNERLVGFLTSLPVESEVGQTDGLDKDVIAWELFRQILSPRIDPLSAKTSETVARLMTSRGEQVRRLRAKCLVLAEQFKTTVGLEDLPRRVETLIKAHVQNEIAELLELDKRTLEQFFASIFADQKNWVALFSWITGIVFDRTVLTLGAAIAALSSVTASAFKAVADRRTKLRISDYALIYTLSKWT